jgi:hypothetical protein
VTSSRTLHRGGPKGGLKDWDVTVTHTHVEGLSKPLFLADNDEKNGSKKDELKLIGADEIEECLC